MVEDLFYQWYEHVAFKIMVAEMDVSELHIGNPRKEKKKKTQLEKKRFIFSQKVKKGFLALKQNFIFFSTFTFILTIFQTYTFIFLNIAND